MSAFSDDLAAAFEELLDAFGEDATIDGTEVIGIFDDAYASVPGDGEVGFSSTSPVLHVRAEDAALATVNTSVVVVKGTSYWLRDKQPDGEGVVALILGR